MAFKKEPDIYLGKQPYYFHFIGVDVETNETKDVYQKDAKNGKRFDRFAKTFGYHAAENLNVDKKLSSAEEKSSENTF